MSAIARGEIPDSVWLPIALEVSRALEVPVQKMMHGGNAKRFLIARMRFWKRLRDLPAGYSFAAIGNVTGHKPVSVMNGVGPTSDSLTLRTAPKRVAKKPPANPWPKMIDKRFGRLLVVGRAEAPAEKQREGRKERYWRCQCSCGGERIASTNQLQRSKVRTCGTCSQRQAAACSADAMQVAA